MNNFSTYWELVLFLLPFGGLWAITISIVDLIVISFPGIESNKNWKTDLYLWVFKLILVIHVFYFVRGILCDWNCIDLLEYLQLWLSVLLIFMITYIPTSFYGKYLYFHSLLGVSSEKDQFFLKGEGKESLGLNLDKIVYIKSDDNYIDIFTLSVNNELEKIVIRATIKMMEEQLKDFPQFLRIHRSYLINTIYISRLERIDLLILDASGKRIDLPVSKTYQDVVKELIIHPK